MDPVTGLPLKEKISKLTVVLDKSVGGAELAEVSLNMADFNFGDYKIKRLTLAKLPNA